jgi:uncharacterized protein
VAKTILDIDTPHGPAQVHLHAADDPAGALVLGHGASGGVEARDMKVATEAALGARCSVALVEQPYRVAGRRSPAPARQLDAAWTAVVEHLRGDPLAGLPLITGGRSAGARVACRTVDETGAVAVLCLAFPVHPPGKPEKDRLPELAQPTVPILVVQGQTDPFGRPEPAPGRDVVLLRGDHSLKSDAPGLRQAVRSWLGELLPE